MNFIEYLFKGFMHWLSLLLGMLDFKDIRFMWLVVIGILIVSIFNKDLRKSILEVLKSLFSISKKLIGLLFLILFISYYIYIAIFFEDSISIGLLIVSIWLIGNDFIKTILSLTTDSDIGLLESLKEICIPVLLLYLHQIIIMFESNNFDNVLLVNLSLLVIPIYSIFFFILKHFVCFEDIYKRYESKIKFEGHYFMRIFNESLIESGNYKINRKILEEFLKDNCLLEYKEMKAKLISDLPFLLKKYKEKKLKNNKKKQKTTKPKKVLLLIWLLNIFCLVDFVLKVRFFDGSFGFLYYVSLFILLIYLWVDFMKIKNIKNQFDFVIYGLIYIVLIIFITWYTYTLNAFRLSELGFIIPILVIIHFRYFKNNFPNFLIMPGISENNFFGMSE